MHHHSRHHLLYVQHALQVDRLGRVNLVRQYEDREFYDIPRPGHSAKELFARLRVSNARRQGGVDDENEGVAVLAIYKRRSRSVRQAGR